MSEEKVFKDDGDLRSWLELQALSVSAEIPYLLAHADDGVIWGRFDNGKLTTASEVFTEYNFPKLRLKTLQQCRIFGVNAEVRLWKFGQKWKIYTIADDNQKECLPDEHQILWGTKVENESDKFILVSDGSQGLRHAVPLSNITDKFKTDKRPLRLTVRHYIKYDEDTGVARIYLSRLVHLDCTT